MEGILDQLTRQRSAWETSIQVLSNEGGAQVLSQGLQFVGVICEVNSDNSVSILTGTSAADHQTHTVDHARKVILDESNPMEAATLDIEDMMGVKTLITFTRPMPFALETKQSAELVLEG